MINSCRDGKEIWVPFDATPYCSTLAFDAAFPILNEVVASLKSLNIAVEQVYKGFCIVVAAKTLLEALWSESYVYVNCYGQTHVYAN